MVLVSDLYLYVFISYLFIYVHICTFITFQVSSPLVSRVATVEKCFNKEMELEPRVSPDFELSLDDHSVLRAIQTLNFFQMKGKIHF